MILSFFHFLMFNKFRQVLKTCGVLCSAYVYTMPQVGNLLNNMK